MTTPPNILPAPSALAHTEPLTAATLRQLVELSLRNAPANPVIVKTAIITVVSATALIGVSAVLVDHPHPLLVVAVALPVVCFVLLVLTVLLLWGTVWWWGRNARVVGYFTPRSSQLVHPQDGAWLLSDHFTMRRGRGEAGSFRRAVFAHLAEQADRHDVLIRMETRAERLAELYMADMPGLEVTVQRRRRTGVMYTLERQPGKHIATGS